MNIVVRNQARLPKKYIRLLKWKLYRLRNKFGHIGNVHIYITSEGQNPAEYFVRLIFGLPGQDLVLANRSNDVLSLLNQSVREANHHLSKRKKR
jgi:hypothetical protein